MKILALVPARGGSKRIVGKNIRPFCGKPMIAWPLAVLKQCGFVDHIMVSTDDEEIARLAKQLGAQVPFLRPADISSDHATTMAVIRHGLEWHEANVGAVDLVLTVYPTAVFLQKDDLETALSMIDGDGVQHVFPGAEFAYPIQRAVMLDNDNRVSMVAPEHQQTRSQDLAPTFHDAGQFYLSRVAAIRNNVPIIGEQSKMLVLPRKRVVDIDTMEDFELAEQLFAAQGRGDTH